MSKNGVLKSSYIIMNPTETRVIDSNALVENKLKELSMKLAAETGADEGFTDGFTQGIDAMQVVELVGEEYSGEMLAEPQEAIPTSEEIRQQAYEQVEEIKQQALAEIEEMKKQIMEEARQEGYKKGLEAGTQEGYKKGHTEGLNSVQAQREQLLEEISAKVNELDESYQKRIEEIEPRFVETLTGIYEHIFNVSLKNSRDIVVHLLGNAMRNLEGNSGYLVHVSKEDYPFVSMQKKELIKGTGINLDAVDIIEDSTLVKSECMIETGNGVFDCSLGTQLEALNEELRLLSYQPNKEDEDA